MSILIKLIADYAAWLYIFLAFIAFLLVRIITIATRERARSIFALEKETATARVIRSLIYLLVVVLLAVGVFYISHTLVEQVPLPEVTPTPTPVVDLPPTPTTPPLLPTPTPTGTPLPKATPTPFDGVIGLPTPSVEAPQNNPPARPPACPNASARITRPGDGAVVSGYIEIFGSANVDNFEYYKVEFLPPGGSWNFIQSYNSPVTEGMLAGWNTDTVPPGEYAFRLIVVDVTGNYPDPCQINLVVQR